MTELEKMRTRIQNRIICNGASRQVAIAILRQVDEYVDERLRVAESDKACAVADECGL